MTIYCDSSTLRSSVHANIQFGDDFMRLRLLWHLIAGISSTYTRNTPPEFQLPVLVVKLLERERSVDRRAGSGRIVPGTNLACLDRYPNSVRPLWFVLFLDNVAMI